MTFGSLALFVVGCSSPAPQAGPAPTPTSSPSPEPAPIARANPEPAQPAAQPAPQPAAEAAAAPEPQRQASRDNPRRSYQLRSLERITIKGAKSDIRAWVMDTTSRRAEGMMFLTDEEVKADEGMLFVFAQEQPLSFWMRNTLIPLDIAYLDSRRKIVSTHKMYPLDESGVPSKAPAMYALEMKQGAFKRLGIKEGMKLDWPDTVRSKDGR